LPGSEPPFYARLLSTFLLVIPFRLDRGASYISTTSSSSLPRFLSLKLYLMTSLLNIPHPRRGTGKLRYLTINLCFSKLPDFIICALSVQLCFSDLTEKDYSLGGHLPRRLINCTAYVFFFIVVVDLLLLLFLLLKLNSEHILFHIALR